MTDLSKNEVVISVELINSITGYLVQRPYKEVAQLLNHISYELKSNSKEDLSLDTEPNEDKN